MIRVNDDWVIDVDSLNYMPKRDMHRDKVVRRKDGSETVVHDYRGEYGYYTTLKGALRAIARIEYKNALTGSETALTDAIKLMDETVKRFENLLEEIKE